MISPAKDIVLFFPAFWAFVALAIIYFQPTAPAEIVPWHLLNFLNSLHTSLPIAYAAFFMTYISRDRRRQSMIGVAVLFVMSIVILQVAKTHVQLMTVIAPTAFILASTYHFYRQDLGVCSMYRSLDRTVLEWEKKFERWLVLFLAFLGPTIYWLGTGSRYYSVIQLANGPVPIATHSLEILKYFGAFVFLGYLSYQLIWKRNFSLRFIYMTGVFIAFLSMLQPGLFFFPLLVQYFARLTAHDWIEIAFQGKLIGSEMKVRKKGTFVRLALYAITVSAMTYFFAFSKTTYAFMTEIQDHGFLDGKSFLSGMEDPMFQIWATLYVFASACHYYIGRYVYDFSVPEFRTKIGFGVKS